MAASNADGPRPAGGAAAPVAPVTHLLYLHGFRSGPLSTKAQQTQAWLQRHAPHVTWACPQLPMSPRAAVAHCESILARWPLETTALVGSSLGGWYAMVLAERHGCRAALLNPAVHAARDLATQVGTVAEWHTGKLIEFTTEHVQELRALQPGPLTRMDRYSAVIAKGDEVLDWHEMVAALHGARIELLAGGDHALTGFETQVGNVMRGLGVEASQRG